MRTLLYIFECRLNIVSNFSHTSSIAHLKRIICKKFYYIFHISNLKKKIEKLTTSIMYTFCKTSQSITKLQLNYRRFTITPQCLFRKYLQSSQMFVVTLNVFARFVHSNLQLIVSIVGHILCGKFMPVIMKFLQMY